METRRNRPITSLRLYSLSVDVQEIGAKNKQNSNQTTDNNFRNLTNFDVFF